jgi:DNA-binding CsgD family transcriptional regulator
MNQSDCFKNSVTEINREYRTIQYHTGDRDLWCKQVFPDILKFFKTNSLNDCVEHRISFNHRYLLPNGRIGQYLHEGKLDFKEQYEHPVIELIVFTELGQIKADDSISLSISLFSDELGFNTVFNKNYFPEKQIILSEREREILHYCKEGLSGKMIADKLKISIHTVKNHKRNIMTKTSTHNITGLIHYCNKFHCL